MMRTAEAYGETASLGAAVKYGLSMSGVFTDIKRELQVFLFTIERRAEGYGTG